jgi:hypothetical protein
VVAVLVVGTRFSAKLAERNFRRRISAALGRWTRWEFWPAWLFYIPVALHYIRLSIRYRGVTVPTAANPGILSGGFVGESKMAMLRELYTTSPKLTAEAFFLPALSDNQPLARFDTRPGADLPEARQIPGCVNRSAISSGQPEHSRQKSLALQDDVASTNFLRSLPFWQ